MIRILHVIPSLIKGGAERLALDILRASGQIPSVEVKLVYFKNINEYAEEYKGLNVQLINAWVRPSVLRTWDVNLNEWESLLCEFKPDVIHSHLFEADLLARYNLHRNIKYFSHCHDNMNQLRSLRHDRKFSKKRLTDLYERRFLMRQYEKCENTFISVSPSTTLYFKENLSAKLTSRIMEFPNAIDVNRFSVQKSKPPVNDDPIRILNVGSFIPVKNQALLVKIATLLEEKGINFQIRFAGEGPELNKVQKSVTNLGLTDKIVFLGNVQNIQEEMWRSHICVHTSVSESFGLILVEAMAAGLPIIALDGIGNRDLIVDGENGFFIKTQNPKEFAERIIKLKDDQNQWLKFSNSGIEFSKKFDIRNYVQQLLEIYQDQSNRSNE
ncbi:MAG: glycosyltransferase family 4 protein [Flavobacteriales bacterium]|nr:glycosyltransferase family 4 protein [Flavobacteriales bacterium]